MTGDLSAIRDSGFSEVVSGGVAPANCTFAHPHPSGHGKVPSRAGEWFFPEGGT